MAVTLVLYLLLGTGTAFGEMFRLLRQPSLGNKIIANSNTRKCDPLYYSKRFLGSRESNKLGNEHHYRILQIDVGNGKKHFEHRAGRFAANYERLLTTPFLSHSFHPILFTEYFSLTIVDPKDRQHWE